MDTTYAAIGQTWINPTTDTYLPHVHVTADDTETGSGCYDVRDHGVYLGYIYQYRGQWWCVSIRRGDRGALAFLRSKDAVSHLVLDYRNA